MKSLVEMHKDVEAENKEIKKLKDLIAQLEKELQDSKICLESSERRVAGKTINLHLLAEIYRLAQYQFSRLRNQPRKGLSTEDIAEIDKWVDRIKTDEGIGTVLGAFQELDKYQPSEIKSNLYALVQKIIIGGAYGKKGKS